MAFWTGCCRRKDFWGQFKYFNLNKIITSFSFHETSYIKETGNTIFINNIYECGERYERIDWEEVLLITWIEFFFKYFNSYFDDFVSLRMVNRVFPNVSLFMWLLCTWKYLCCKTCHSFVIYTYTYYDIKKLFQYFRTKEMCPK